MWHDFQLYAVVVPDATRSVEEIALFILDAQGLGRLCAPTAPPRIVSPHR